MKVASSAPKRKGTDTKVPLEAELCRVLGQLSNARDRSLVARHLGWDGDLPCSLNKAGARFHLSRERARQVYAEAVPRLRRSAGTPSLDAVLAFVRKHQYELVSEVEQKLQEQEFTKGPFSLRGVQTAARLLDRAPSFDLDLIGGVWFIGRVSEPARILLTIASKQVEHHGATSTSFLRQEMWRKYRRRVSHELVRRILRTRWDICWLDSAGEWFWLTSLGRNRLLARLKKILALVPRIPLSNLYEAILRDYKPLQIPEFVFRSFCGTLSWCCVNAHEVSVRTELGFDSLPTGGESIVCNILREHGEAMQLSLLRERCFEAGLTRANLWRVLAYSPLIRRFDKGLYGFITAGDIEGPRR